MLELKRRIAVTMKHTEEELKSYKPDTSIPEREYLKGYMDALKDIIINIDSMVKEKTQKRKKEIQMFEELRKKVINNDNLL